MVKNKIFTLAACVLMARAAWADPTAFGTNLQWEVNDNALRITLVDADQDGTMPTDWNEADVPWYGVRGSLTSVSLPDGLTNIGFYAFAGCNALTQVTIPGSVTDINPSAFMNCTGLTTASLPTGLTSLGASAFSGCSSLTLIDLPDLPEIKAMTFQGCAALTEVTIPATVSTIGIDAFKDCTALQRVNCMATEVPALIDGDVFANHHADFTICVTTNAAARAYRRAANWGTYYSTCIQNCSTPTYSIKVSEMENGTVTADKTEAIIGEEVTLTFEPDNGYHVNSLTVTARYFKDEDEGNENASAYISQGEIACEQIGYVHYSFVLPATLPGTPADYQETTEFFVTATFGTSPATGIDAPAAEAGIVMEGNILRNPAHQAVSLYTAAGRFVAATTGALDLSTLPAGTYLVRTPEGGKVVVRN